METAELMIGDWVMRRGEPTMVYEIDDYYERINTEPDGYNAITCIEISEVTPIPLTTEILKKNGFQQISITEYVSGKVTISILVEGFLIIIKSGNARVRITIKYVHELQHALRLCGIEKEIEI